MRIGKYLERKHLLPLALAMRASGQVAFKFMG
jgi:hypothetical protein